MQFVGELQHTFNDAAPTPQQAMPRKSLSLYLHFPFCRVRCAYCDFNTYAGLDDLMAPYARALAREVRQVGASVPADLGPVHTIFFGGGTPSLMPLENYGEIFGALNAAFELAAGCEITLEANPGTVDARYLAGLRALGVNRLSFGVQSSHAWELNLLDRLHTFEDVVEAVRLARAAGFDTLGDGRGLNLDLIFALPHQTLPEWQATLLRVLDLEPDHLSLYALSLEQGTPLRSWVQRGLLPLPDPDLAADMYTWAAELLAERGYEQYEISNWAKQPGATSGTDTQSGHSPLGPEYACRHNLQYWRNQPYLGFGAGAHGCAGGWRYSNVLAPAGYISRLAQAVDKPFPFSAATVETTAVSIETAMDETMMLGMRLVREGVRETEFEARFGLGLDARYGRRLRRLQVLG